MKTPGAPAVWKAEIFIGCPPEAVPPLLCALRRLPVSVRQSAVSLTWPRCPPRTWASSPSSPPPLPSSCSELLSVPQINHPPLTCRPLQRLIPCLQPGSPPASLPAPSHPQGSAETFPSSRSFHKFLLPTPGPLHLTQCSDFPLPPPHQLWSPRRQGLRPVPLAPSAEDPSGVSKCWFPSYTFSPVSGFSLLLPTSTKNPSRICI